MKSLRVFYLANDVWNKAWAQITHWQEQIFLDFPWKKTMPCWWAIFKNISHRVTKQDVNHSGHAIGMTKETKRVWHLLALLDS